MGDFLRRALGILAAECVLFSPLAASEGASPASEKPRDAGASSMSSSEPSGIAAGAGRGDNAPESRSDSSAGEQSDEPGALERLRVGVVIAGGPVQPRGGGIIESGGIRVSVPDGAVEEALMISVLRLENTPPVPEGRANATGGAAGYRFLPRGIRFAKPVEITMPYDTDVNRSQAALDNLFTYFYSEEHRRWERLPRVNLDVRTSRITSITTHFTDMVNTTLTLPEGPDPVNFDLNSIKDLEAARPDAGIPGIEGLKPGWSGRASFSIPLSLPPGRGAAPRLSLSYDSSRSSGLMGLGFTVSLSSIETDTRFGVPDYQGNDTYRLNGEELILQSTPESGTLQVYRQRREGRFARIHRRYDPSAGEDWWEITDKEGTKRYYGDFGRGIGGAWLGPGRGEAVGFGNVSQGVYRWHLSRIEDTDGNVVDYRYEYNAGDRNTYPKQIAWSGLLNRDGSGDAFSDRDHALYSLEFIYNQPRRILADHRSGRLGIGAPIVHQGKTWLALSGNERPDTAMEARGRFPSATSRHLDRIAVRYKGVETHSYEFFYRLSEFGRLLLSEFAGTSPGDEELFRYRFDYEHMDSHGSDGYMGFSAPRERAMQTINPPRSSNTTTIGANGHFGAGIVPVSLALTGSGSGGFTLQLGDIEDLDGNGLPEIIWGNLLSQIEGEEIETGRRTRLNEAPGLVTVGSNTHAKVSLGGRLGVGPAFGTVTHQWDWTWTKRALMDMDGDGFIDLLKGDVSEYGRNDGNGNITMTPFAGSARNVPKVRSDYFTPGELEQIEGGYARIDPVRRWTSYRSGRVTITDDISYADITGLDPSSDGVSAEIYAESTAVAEDRRKNTLTLTPAAPEVAGVSRSFDIQKGESIFYRLNSSGTSGGNDERGDIVNWLSAIRYQEIELFEDMESLPVMNPRTQLSSLEYSALGVCRVKHKRLGIRAAPFQFR